MVRFAGMVALGLACAGALRLALDRVPSASGGMPTLWATNGVSAPFAQVPPSDRYIAVGQIDLADVTGMAALNDLLFLADSTFGLQVYEVTEPSAPVRRGLVAALQASSVVVDGDTALVSHEPHSVSVFDVSNVSAPRLLGTMRLGRPVTSLAARGGIGVLGDDRDLVTFDYRTPSAPRETGRVEIAYLGPLDLALAGQLAYVAQNGARLRVVDVGDPANPRLRGNLAADPYLMASQSLIVDGAHVYVGERLHGAYFIPTRLPPTPGPSPTGPTPTPGPRGTAPPDGGRLSVVDVTDPDSPQELGTSDAFYGGPIAVVRADGHRLWMIERPDSGRRRLHIVDVSDPEHPVDAALDLDPRVVWDLNPQDLAIDGDVVYVADAEGVLVLRREHDGWQTATPTLTPGTPTPTASPPRPLPDLTGVFLPALLDSTAIRATVASRRQIDR